MNIIRWICKDANGNNEIINVYGSFKPYNAICEMPYENGKQVSTLDYVIVKWFYYLPGTLTEVELADENSIPPSYYKNFITNTWITPVPEPVPVYWDDNGVWKDTDFPDNPDKKIKSVQQPQKFAKALVDENLKLTYLNSQISNLKSSKKKKIEIEYEQTIMLIKSQYPESERDAWDKKEEEAIKWNSLTDKTSAISDNTVFPLLYEEALQGDYSLTSVEKIQKIDTLVAKVLNNAYAYKSFSGKCTGLYKKARDEINNYSGTYEQTKSFIDSYTISWPSIT